MVYLYHFVKPYRGRAQHYLGSTNDLKRRHQEHISGRGSPLIRAALAAGIDMYCIPLFPNEGHKLERAIKLQKNSRRICPLCNTYKRFKLA
ncbi:MAG: GIY-YIG nuclease family protein [Myxacorys californica WJT36-NPBG1]|jgi:predicted GIY-YIG superfamily endonuclease|nr:GIY-YIG nuclease family protein [Myxacorys californica WJT36-NPBG1]